MKSFDTTLLFIIKEDNILLAEKKRGFGIGKINGIGGKVEKGETIEEGMIRETLEEINVFPKNYKKVAVINFDLYSKNEIEHEIMHLYVANDYEGTICESDEMKPQWFKISDIPYERMFEGDEIWMKKLLNNEEFVGHFKFNEDFKLISYAFEN